MPSGISGGMPFARILGMLPEIVEQTGPQQGPASATKAATTGSIP